MLKDFAGKAGATNVSFYDVYGTDPDLLAMVPQPCLAVMLLFPCDMFRTEKEEQRKKIEAEVGRLRMELPYDVRFHSVHATAHLPDGCL